MGEDRGHSRYCGLGLSAWFAATRLAGRRRRPEGGEAVLGGDPREAAFEQLWSTLFGIAFEILGHFGQCQDVMTECQTQWADLDPADVTDAESHLVRLVTRLSLEAARRR